MLKTLKKGRKYPQTLRPRKLEDVLSRSGTEIRKTHTYARTEWSKKLRLM